MPRILVLHPDPAQLDTIITKVNTLNKKSGPFDALLLLGDNVIDDTTTLSGSGFDIPSYIAEGSDTVEDSKRLDQKISNNLTYMNQFSTLTTSDGLKFAFVTGNDEYLTKNIEKLQEDLRDKDIDILITYQWPKIIAQEQELFIGDSRIDRLVKAAKPRYHFAVGSKAGKFFERSPFQWEDGKVTRFISLARFGGSEKWIYAFNINTTEGDLPKNLTPNPFTEEEKLQIEESKKRKFEEEEARLVKKPQRKVVLPENCFFCLSNPKLQSHMIISIGENAYITIAKGPLTKPTDLMKFSGHCLIIPIPHIPCLAPTEDAPNVMKTPLFNEILRYQVSLVKLYATFKLGTVFFQINKSDSVHFHIQAFPIASDFLVDFEKTLNKNVNLNNTRYTNRSNFDFKKFTSGEDEEYLKIINSKKDYIQFSLFDQSVQKQTIFISYLEEGKALDLQFGRRVLAYLLQTPKRIKWDACQQTQEREEMETEAFKKHYELYDFTLSN